MQLSVLERSFSSFQCLNFVKSFLCGLICFSMKNLSQLSFAFCDFFVFVLSMLGEGERCPMLDLFYMSRHKRTSKCQSEVPAA